MSGPWDRPSSSDPEEEWPSEDRDTPGPDSSDATQRTDWASPAWEDWPAPAAPVDDVVVEEPPLPSSDPWAESWTDDDPSPALPSARSWDRAPEVPV